MHVGVKTTGLWFRHCKTVVFGSCSSSTFGRPCDCAATQFRNWRCLRFSSSPELADNPVATETVTLPAWVRAMIFCSFSAFFAHLRVVPELSACLRSWGFFVTEGSGSGADAAS